VVGATSYSEAKAALTTEHFHLAIIDIRLVEEDKRNQEGLKLLADIEQLQLKEVMPCIVLTAHATKKNILTAYEELGVAHFIEKQSGYRQKLLKAVQDLFEKRLRINFELVYDEASDRLIPAIAQDVHWAQATVPETNLLVPQVQDLLGKLFFGAKTLFVEKLQPGLTGAAVLRAQANWGYGIGPSLVVKVSRRDKIKTESHHFEKFVRPYLPANTVTQISTEYSRHLGVLLYTFAEDDQSPMREFDDFYQNHPAQDIIASLRDLFQNTYRYWTDSPDRQIRNLPQLYYNAFQLREARLLEAINEVVPRFSPQDKTLTLPRLLLEMTNPVTWLADHRDRCAMPVYHCITHGDLTGRNIMVSDKGKCWLIDFYRTYESHILRDFVILETDIKYRLLPKAKFESFLLLENSLLAGQSSPMFSRFSPDLQKAAEVVAALRDIAYEFLQRPGNRAEENRREYLLSLLMTTLNVVRLRHIDPERKLQAMFSAGLICDELDRLAGRSVNHSNGAG
jgi:CheY-like chemotaxis protein